MALIITTPWLSMGMVGSAYFQTLVATGGTAPYTWLVVPGSGSLPAGYTLDPVGIISGVSLGTGLSTFQLQATDSLGVTVVGNMQLSVAPPAMTLVTALADQYSNSYVDVPYCDLYWSQHWNTVGAAQWAQLLSAQKVSLLIQACRILETVRFTALKQLRAPLPLRYDRHSRLVMTLEDQPVPTKWLWTQRLQFPRNLDHDFNTGGLYVPEPIMMAQCEQAVYSLNFDTTSIANRLQGVTQDIMYVGNIHLRQNLVQGGSEFSPRAMEMCRPYFLATTYEVRRQ